MSRELVEQEQTSIVSNIQPVIASLHDATHPAFLTYILYWERDAYHPCTIVAVKARGRSEVHVTRLVTIDSLDRVRRQPVFGGQNTQGCEIGRCSAGNGMARGSLRRRM